MQQLQLVSTRAHVKIASRIVLQNFVKNSGKKFTLPGTRYAAGQFRDYPGESGTVGNPIRGLLPILLLGEQRHDG